MTIAAVGFDLDYTLWDQDQFPLSFFEAIAPDLGGQLGCHPARVAAAFHAALERLTLHHPRLLGAALADLGIRDLELERKLVGRYRAHRPPMRLYPGALQVLEQLKAVGYRLFLVTDGYGSTQRYKVEALGLAPCFETMVFTGELGAHLQKPSPAPFRLAAARLGLPGSACVYIGDDPQLDFLGARLLGIRTIGVATGPFAGLPVAKGLAPDLRIGALGELEQVLAGGPGQRGAARPAPVRAGRSGFRKGLPGGAA